MNEKIIGSKALERRATWVERLGSSRGSFLNNTSELTAELQDEISNNGKDCIIDHLRLCGHIPEKYKHDSSEEKLYSKYTDTLVALAFESMGIRSLVLTERADAADVECSFDDVDFVADAKAFRLSRTARNAKDFKVQSMHGWKRGRKHAIVIAPLYQYPSRTSQIYKEAIERDVCLLSFSHLALLSDFSNKSSTKAAQGLLKRILQSVSTLNPTKDAVTYWTAINRSPLDFSPSIQDFWIREKLAAAESLTDAKEEGLRFLSEERRRILKMSPEEVLRELIGIKIGKREKKIKSFADNRLMELS